MGESGYFDNAAESKVMLHLWSLAVEEQFYIFWPLSLALCWRKGWDFLRITLVVAMVSFFASVYLLTNNPTAAFYSPISRFWELMVGGVLAYISLHRTELSGRYKNEQSIFGLLLLVFGAAFITKTRAFPGWWALLPTLGAFFIISAGPSAWVNRKILSNKCLVWVGLISYPLYLWHWPLLSLASIIESGTPSRAIRLTVVLSAFVLAFLTYKFVEKPIRSNGGNKNKSIVLAILIASVGVLGLICYNQDGFINRKNILGNSDALKQLGDAPPEYINNPTCTNKFPYEKPGNANHWFCMLSKDESPTLLLLGNSFANHHYPGFANSPALKHHSILSIGIRDAAEPAEAGEEDFVQDKNSACNKKNKLKEQLLIDSIIEDTKTIRFAIIDGLRRNPDIKYIDRLRKRVDFLEKNNIRAIIFIPHFIHFMNIKDCISRPFRDAANCDFNINERTDLTKNFDPLAEQISSTNKNVLFFDQNDLFCDEKKCSLLRNGMPLSRDLKQDEHGGHFSLYASNESTKLFVEWAKKHSPDLLK